VAATLIEGATASSIEAALRRLDAAATDPGDSVRRTRVATHIAWVPAEWEEAARATLAGLENRHPSRTIVLLPDPGSDRDAIDAEVEVRVFSDGPRAIASEVVMLRLRGARSRAPGSVVTPLLVSDLPVFLRWRGPVPFGSREPEQLTGVADRLIVDSREWSEPAAAYAHLPGLFDRLAVSDLAWARIEPWRAAMAALWPGIADMNTLSIRGPAPEALLLRGWLASRLNRAIALEHELGPDVERVAVDGVPVRPTRAQTRSPSDLLSEQFEIHAHDPIFEAAARAVA
jgi:glucose-6-phosphate dehydrogenase assembly protein OpcA